MTKRPNVPKGKGENPPICPTSFGWVFLFPSNRTQSKQFVTVSLFIAPLKRLPPPHSPSHWLSMLTVCLTASSMTLSLLLLSLSWQTLKLLRDKGKTWPWRHILLLLETGKSPTPTLWDELPELLLLLWDQHCLELQNTILVRKRQVGDQLYYQLVLPQKFRAEVLSKLHDKMGHLGIERTLDLCSSKILLAENGQWCMQQSENLWKMHQAESLTCENINLDQETTRPVTIL